MKLFKLWTLLAFCTMLFAAPLDAKPRSGGKAVHRKGSPHAVTHRPAVAYHPVVAHRPVVRHVGAAPVHVVHHAPVYRVAPVVTTRTVVATASPQRTIETGWRPGLALGLRPSAILLEGQKLALSRFENPALGGLGLVLRGDVTPSFSLELSFDYLVGGVGDFRQRTMPLMLSGVFHFFPDARLNPYVLAGAGVHVTELSYGNRTSVHELWELAGQLGAGVRVRLTESFEVFGDVRGLSVYKNLSEVHYGGAYDPDDRFNVGAQFSAGLAYRF